MAADFGAVIVVFIIFVCERWRLLRLRPSFLECILKINHPEILFDSS